MREMRRKDRQVSDIGKILDIIRRCDVCRIGFYHEEEVYIVPLNFGFKYENEKLNLYFHSASKGRKADMLQDGPLKVGIEMDCSHKLIEAEIACEYSFNFESVIGNGVTQVIEDKIEKIQALNHIMYQQTGKHFEFEDKMVNATLVYKVELKSYTAKSLFN